MMDYGSNAIYGKVFVIWSCNAHEFIGESEAASRFNQFIMRAQNLQ